MGKQLQALNASMDDYESGALITVARESAVFPVPTDATAVRFDGPAGAALDAVLDDPTLLRGYRSSTQDQTSTDALPRYWLLCDLVCALEQHPADEIPARFRARAARLRFLVWSLPARLPGGGPELFPVRSAVLSRHISRPEAYERARTARQDWLACLAAADNDPWLLERRARQPRRFDDDHRWLTEQWPARRRPGQLALLSTDPGDPHNATDHREIAGRIVESHWLAIGSVQAAARALSPDHLIRRGIAWVVPALAVALGLAFTLWPGPEHARWLAAVALLVPLVLATVLPSGLDALMLLRLPAAVAVGTAALLALTPRWWVSSHGWLVGLGVLGAAVLYLVLETRLHNITATTALGRGLPIAFIGLAYAFLISLVVLGFAAPAVAEHGQCLIGWWNHSPWQPRTLTTQCTESLGVWPDGQPGVVAAPAATLATLTGWSFGIGIAVQLLWDDQPVTAPLGRQRRRGANL